MITNQPSIKMYRIPYRTVHVCRNAKVLGT